MPVNGGDVAETERSSFLALVSAELADTCTRYGSRATRGTFRIGRKACTLVGAVGVVPSACCRAIEYWGSTACNQLWAPSTTWEPRLRTQPRGMQSDAVRRLKC